MCVAQITFWFSPSCESTQITDTPGARGARFDSESASRGSRRSSTRAVLQVFEKYQKDRVTFVQTVAELATRPQVRVVLGSQASASGAGEASLTGTPPVPQNIEVLQQAGVMALLRPLLLDNVPRRASRARCSACSPWKESAATLRTHSGPLLPQHPTIRGGGARASREPQRRAC